MPITKTLFFAGTDFNETSRGELLAELYHSAQADEKGKHNSIFFAGPGSGGKLFSEGPYRKDYTKSARSNRRAEINRQLDRTFGKDGMANNVERGKAYIKAAINEAVQNARNSGKAEDTLVLNMLGWSRGAVTAVALSNAIKDLEAQAQARGIKLVVNWCFIDPVPGPSNRSKEKHQIVPGVVKNAFVIYASDEKRSIMQPAKLKIANPTQDTKIQIMHMPGEHSSPVLHSRAPNLQFVPNITWRAALDFLEDHGSSFKKETIKYDAPNSVNPLHSRSTERKSYADDWDQPDTKDYKYLEELAKLNQHRLTSHSGLQKRGAFRVHNQHALASSNQSAKTKGYFQTKLYATIFEKKCPTMFKLITSGRVEDIDFGKVTTELTSLRENNCIQTLTAIKPLIKKYSNGFNNFFEDISQDAKNSVPKVSPSNAEQKRKGQASYTQSWERKRNNKDFATEIVKKVINVPFKALPVIRANASLWRQHSDALPKIEAFHKIMEICNYYGSKLSKESRLKSQHIPEFLSIKRNIESFLKNLDPNSPALMDEIQAKFEELQVSLQERMSEFQHDYHDPNKFRFYHASYEAIDKLIKSHYEPRQSNLKASHLAPLSTLQNTPNCKLFSSQENLKARFSAINRSEEEILIPENPTFQKR